MEKGQAMNEEFKVIGKPYPRVEGLSKATGQAQYASDNLLPGMLFCKLLRSPHPMPGSSALIAAQCWPIRAS